MADPHEHLRSPLPYDPPPEYRDRYDAGALAPPLFRDSDLAAQEWVAEIESKPRRCVGGARHAEIKAAYYAMIELLDDMIGGGFSALDRRGRRDNMLIRFMSDHGEMLGDHGLLLKGCRFFRRTGPGTAAVLRAARTGQRRDVRRPGRGGRRCPHPARDRRPGASCDAARPLGAPAAACSAGGRRAPFTDALRVLRGAEHPPAKPPRRPRRGALPPQPRHHGTRLPLQAGRPTTAPARASCSTCTPPRPCSTTAATTRAVRRAARPAPATRRRPGLVHRHPPTSDRQLLIAAARRHRVPGPVLRKFVHRRSLPSLSANHDTDTVGWAMSKAFDEIEELCTRSATASYGQAERRCSRRRFARVTSLESFSNLLAFFSHNSGVQPVGGSSALASALASSCVEVHSKDERSTFSQ